jgi:hypothetical protein
MDHVKPSATKAFNSPLANIPSGAWGSMRTIQVESTGSKDLVPQLISSTMENYYVTNAFAEYRQLLAEFLNSRKLFQCAACLRPLYSKHQWILCMRCLAVPYCSTTCIHTHKALHVIGCKTHHVWRAGIEPPKPTSTVDSNSISTSTSSSSSEGKGGKGKGKGKGKGQHDQHSSRKRPRTCWHYTTRGSCKDGDQCGALHDNEARLRYLDDERRRLQSSLSTVAQQLPRSYGPDDGDADGNDANWQ